MAVTAFRAREVNRIILTRPAVEAGSSVFCPATSSRRWTPISARCTTRCSTCSARRPTRSTSSGEHRGRSLAYMRGRTLDDSYIILDEAQNTSPEQMKMFLTRLGFGSKMVITGDITQIDLPDGRRSGLRMCFGFYAGSTTLRRSSSMKRMLCATGWCRI